MRLVFALLAVLAAAAAYLLTRHRPCKNDADCSAGQVCESGGACAPDPVLTSMPGRLIYGTYSDVAAASFPACAALCKAGPFTPTAGGTGAAMPCIGAGFYPALGSAPCYLYGTTAKFEEDPTKAAAGDLISTSLAGSESWSS